MTDPINKVPPPQRCSSADFEALTDRLFTSRDSEIFLRSGALKDCKAEPIAVSLLLDIVMDLRDLREHVAAPGDDPEERVRWHIEQIAAEFAAVQRALVDVTT